MHDHCNKCMNIDLKQEKIEHESSRRPQQQNEAAQPFDLLPFRLYIHRREPENVASSRSRLYFSVPRSVLANASESEPVRDVTIVFYGRFGLVNFCPFVLPDFNNYNIIIPSHPFRFSIRFRSVCGDGNSTTIL